METSLKAGLFDVVYKFHHKGVKVVICRYLESYNYFFALRGDVYLDFCLPPNEKELREHKTTLRDIEHKIISNLCARAIENIEFHKRSWYNKIIKQINATTTRWFNEFKCFFRHQESDRRGVNFQGGRQEGSGDEQNNVAGQKAAAS